MAAETLAAKAPAYFAGFMAPVPDEIEAFDLDVEGALPPELDGLYARNGANPLPGQDPGHNFTGQGMVHGIRLAGGRACWYRNKWVKTPALQGARSIRADGSRDLTASLANTSILGYDGHIFALVENCLPFVLDDELNTHGPYDFGGALKGPMTAHPKVDPATGLLHFFGYDARPPFVVYHVASPDGQLLRSVPVNVNGPTMMHDFAITDRHIVFLDAPVIFDRELIGKAGMPYRWSDDYPPRIGVMAHDGGAETPRWFQVKPGYSFHVGNAHEDDRRRIIVEAVNYDRTSFNLLWTELGGHSVLSAGEAQHEAKSGGSFHRWILDPAADTVREEPIDDLAIEFPTINPMRTGQSNRYTYAVNTPLLTDRDGARIVRYDRRNGTRTEHLLDVGWIPGEAIFVPAAGGSSEDDGWLISIVTHRSEDLAQLLVQDAADPGLKPVAKIRLPRRVPAGFHGAWIDMAGMPLKSATRTAG